jgi:hypothetical protein
VGGNDRVPGLAVDHGCVQLAQDHAGNDTLCLRGLELAGGSDIGILG